MLNKVKSFFKTVFDIICEVQQQRAKYIYKRYKQGKYFNSWQ